MTTDHFLSIDDLSASIGTPACPAVVDARTDEDFQADPRLIPGAVRRPGLEAGRWAAAFAGRDTAVYCERGLKISQGAAAWLRHAGARGRALEGGFRAWREARLPLVPEDRLPPRDSAGRTVWVAAAAPGADRLAAGWLIRRLVDPAAVLLFVEEAEVAAVADRFGAVAFGTGDSRFADLIERFGLDGAALSRLAAVVAGAAPESAGLKAALDGAATPDRDERSRLEAAFAVCDAFYRWCRAGAREGTG